jgi:outer membrane protein assembly factor BamB
MSTRPPVLTLIVLLLSCSRLHWPSPVQAADWPQFRGLQGNATADGVAPLEWSATENVLWKAPLPGRGSSCPVVCGERVFLTAYTGYGLSAEEPGRKEDLKLHTLCFDRRTGRLLWDRAISGSEHTQQAAPRVVDHGFATATPATDGEAVYAAFGVSGVVAYTVEGEPLWHADVGTKTAGFGSAASPVVWEDLVFVNASIESGTLYAFHKRTGRVVWQASQIERSWTTPVVAGLPDGSHELIVNQVGEVLAFDPRTGERLWSCAAVDDYIVPTPVHHDGVLYCLGGRGNRCLAVKLGGRGDVTETHRLWMVNLGANVTSPVYHDGHVYWASDKGVMACMDAATGAEVYRHRLPARGRIYASIVRAGGRFYVTTRDNGVVVLAARPEYEELAQNVIETDESLLNAGPAVAAGRLYLRSDEFLYCIGEAGADRTPSP